MPWQALVIDTAFEVDPTTGQLYYTEVDICIPRQCGKTTGGLVVKTFRCTGFSEVPQNVLYLAQSRNKAREKFVEEHVATLLRSKVYRKAFDQRLTNGSEHIKWHNLSRWGIDAPTRTAGHGSTLDHVDIDEAFSQTSWQVENAVRPTMITRPSRQIWPYSTAGDKNSFYWWMKVDAGRRACASGRHGRTAYFEWGAPDAADPSDPRTWRMAIPALGYTITEEAIASEWEQAERLGPEAISMFRRSYLNQWPEIPQLGTAADLWAVISEQEWGLVHDDSSYIADGSSVCFAVDVTPDHAWASIAVCGRSPSGADHVEIVDHQPGTGWLLDRVRDLHKKWRPKDWLLDPATPAGAFQTDIIKITRKTPGLGLRDAMQACGSFQLATTNGTLRHRGQASLSSAVASAVKREVGTRDMWLWDRGGQAPISPLVAATLARWGLHRSTKGNKPVFAF